MLATTLIEQEVIYSFTQDGYSRRTQTTSLLSRRFNISDWDSLVMPKTFTHKQERFLTLKIREAVGGTATSATCQVYNTVCCTKNIELTIIDSQEQPDAKFQNFSKQVEP